MSAVAPEHQDERRRIGVVAPYDFALDRELWRWLPDPVDLLITRTPFEPLPVSIAQATAVGDPSVVVEATRAVLVPEPAVVGYACTSGSFVAGRAGEQALVRAMLDAGAAVAVTTSGAVVQALRALGVERVAVATPYDEEISGLLAAFLREWGIHITAASDLGLHGRIWTVPLETTLDLVRHAWTEDCQAVFVSCTNLATFDAIGLAPRDPGQRLTARPPEAWA